MKKYLVTFCLSLLGFSALAQNIAVEGEVTAMSDGEPLIGATVLVKGTNKGTATDIDGHYILKDVDPKATLVFNYIGYQTVEEKVDGRTHINVQMVETTSSLDELVVVGYGVAKKSDLTSSISTIKGGEINEMVVGNAMDALQGRVPGVQIASGGGPGATPKVMIRGVTTVNGSNPLYVVDGVPLNTSNINFINNNDIESMEVLKDASASAIYGTRASNGVIIITTKSGKAGKTQVDFTASAGWQHIPRPSIASGEEYKSVYFTSYENDGRIAPWGTPEGVVGADWWAVAVNDAALTQNYSLSVRGGTEKYLYSFSLGYFRTNSQSDVGYWDKLNFRLNTEYNFTDWLKVGLDLAPNMESWEDTRAYFGDAMAMDPTTPVFKPESQWDPENPLNDYQRSFNNATHNLALNMVNGSQKTRKMQILMNPFIQIQPIRQLILRAQFGVNAGYQRTDGYNHEFHLDALEQNPHNSAWRNYSDFLNWTSNNTVTFTDTFADVHNLTVMAGFTAERYLDWWAEASRQDIPSRNSHMFQVGAGQGDQSANGNVGPRWSPAFTSLASVLGRVMYNYDSRYYLTASIRYDGSSKFAAGNKWAAFPSVSVAWRLSEEKFMEDTRSWLDNAKIRLGWGKVGNQNINPNLYLSTMDAGKNYVFGKDPSRYPASIVGQVGNPFLKWETVEDIDVGLDLTLFNSRLNITADFYQKTSHDMLYARQSLLTSGNPQWMGAITQNIGEMRATGWEVSLQWNDKAGDFGYNIGLQLTGVRNKALQFSGDGPVWTGDAGLNDYVIKNEDGELISQFFGYRTAGLFQTWEDVYSHTNEHGDLLQPDAQPGDIIFLDTNHDGSLTDADKVYIGNPYPDLMLGFNLGFNYKGFDLLANFYGTFGNDIFNLEKGRYSGSSGSNVYAGTLAAAWHGPGTSNEIPRLSVNDLNQNYRRVSDFFVEDGSYMRCKLLTLGYTLPESVMGKFKLRFYFSAQNLFTITKYKGMDPEAAFANGGAIETGIGNAQYPTPKTFLFGLDFGF